MHPANCAAQTNTSESPDRIDADLGRRPGRVKVEVGD